MKIVSFVFIAIAIALIAFNSTNIDPNALFTGDSMIAFITIVASLCVILMMLILIISKRIEQKTKQRP
ncbi:hypothetical protein ACFFU9_04770 [Mariniflexile ostreae]|uniref:CcmD family protein n=1 Tax=Mariniflexile ostreae TaxID=1520892 RepID=A0ABV5F9C5_9FLAO